MIVPPAQRRVLGIAIIASIVVAVAAAFVGGRTVRPPSGATQGLRAERLVMFAMPGVTWAHTEDAQMPVFDRLVREGATAALAPRSASVKPSAVRGYLTLGAGNRAAAAHDSTVAQRAYDMDAEVVEGITAGSILGSMAGPHREGQIVHLSVPEISVRQRVEFHGTQIGALGEALADAGIDTGIVSAADRAPSGVPPDTGRGAPVLAMVDRAGVVKRGSIRGLVEPARRGTPPFGVVTDPEALARAFEATLEEVDVLLIEPGETLRADELASDAFPAVAARQRKLALERTDRLLGSVVDTLRRGDLLIVVAPSSPSNVDQEHLVPVLAWGSGVEPGLLVSATTRRPGVVALTDVAPTVLDMFGVDRPSSMSGRAMRAVAASGVARPDVHSSLDAQSVFRERFVPAVFYTFVALFVVLSILVGLVFLGRVPLTTPLVAVCYLILAVPLTTFLLNVAPLSRLGIAGAHLVLWSVAIVVASSGWIVPGPRWVGAIPMLAATVAFVATALLTGGHLLVNAVFGNSVLAAGRFYGISNTGSALFFGASVLTLAALGELWPALRSRWWLAAAFVFVLALTGLPPYGADVGGLITGVAAAVVILLVMGEARIPWRAIVLALAAAVVVTLAVAYLDSLRPASEQTHVGRFGEELFGGDGSALTVLTRKASQSWSSLSFSRFTYVVPLGIAALGVLLRRPRGALRTALPEHPQIQAALAGFLVAGVLGFAVNDSGVAVPAMLLAQAVPFVVLVGVHDVRPRSGRDGRAASLQRPVQPLEREEGQHAHQVRAEVDGDPDE